jgi:hypothetical protein
LLTTPSTAVFIVRHAISKYQVKILTGKHLSKYSLVLFCPPEIVSRSNAKSEILTEVERVLNTS